MTDRTTSETGAQRLPVEKLQEWERLGFGMFIHFGMTTFEPFDRNTSAPATCYAPDRLDVDQWVRVARDAGMSYAMLTAKHATGFCLWPSEHTDYHIGRSGNTTDVVAEFVEACRRHSVRPALYLGSYDVHNLHGSVLQNEHIRRPHQAVVSLGRGMPGSAQMAPQTMSAFTTSAYHEFQCALVRELSERYGPVCEFWVDAPTMLGPEGRRRVYAAISEAQPECPILMNNAFGDGSVVNLDASWPTDLLSMELTLPRWPRYDPWFALATDDREPKRYYVPGEMCDSITGGWFHEEEPQLASDSELLGRRLVCAARGCNWLLNVPPDPHGRVPSAFVEALERLARNWDALPSDLT